MEKLHVEEHLVEFMESRNWSDEAVEGILRYIGTHTLSAEGVLTVFEFYEEAEIEAQDKRDVRRLSSDFPKSYYHQEEFID